MPGLLRPRPGSPTALRLLHSIGQGKSQAHLDSGEGGQTQLWVGGAAKSHRCEGRCSRCWKSPSIGTSTGPFFFQELFICEQASTVYPGVGDLESDGDRATDDLQVVSKSQDLSPSLLTLVQCPFK